MRITPRCVACILYARARELERALRDPNERVAHFSTMMEALQLYLVPEAELASLAALSFRRLTTTLGGNPYSSEYKRRLYDTARERIAAVRDLVKSAHEPLDRLRLAVTASALSSRVEEHLESAEPPTHVELIAARMERDDTAKVSDVLAEVENAYYLPTSVAELPYDYILLDLLHEDYDINITALVRREPYADFLTINEVDRYELEDHVDDILEYGSSVTVLRDEAPEVFERLNDPTALVLVKGTMSTLYFHNNRPQKSRVFALFYTSCVLAAEALGVKPKTANAILLEPREEART